MTFHKCSGNFVSKFFKNNADRIRKSSYLHITAGVFVVGIVYLAKLIRPARPTHEKLTTYECGENPEGSPWIKFNIRFYVVALIFLIFDVEVVLLIPWALAYKDFGLTGFLIGGIFLVLIRFGNGLRMEKR